MARAQVARARDAGASSIRTCSDKDVLAAFDTPDEAFDAHADEDRPTNDDGGSPGLGPSVRLIFSLLEQWPVFPVCCVVSSLQSRRVVDGGRRQRAREQRCAGPDVSSGFRLANKTFQRPLSVLNCSRK